MRDKIIVIIVILKGMSVSSPPITFDSKQAIIRALQNHLVYGKGGRLGLGGRRVDLGTIILNRNELVSSMDGMDNRLTVIYSIGLLWIAVGVLPHLKTIGCTSNDVI